MRAIDLLPDKLVARMSQRRGQPHAFRALDPRRTALIVIDMVHLFLEGQPQASTVVDNINTVAHRLRALGGLVLWVRPGSAAHPDLMDAVLGVEPARRYRAAAQDPVLNAHHAALAIEDADLQAQKGLYSAFFPDAGDVAPLLRSRGIDSIMIAGVFTDVCVEASARDAYSAGFKTVVLADACIGTSPAAHCDALAAIHRNFGDVRNVAEIDGLHSSFDCITGA
jgi:nicotinamidase-related amidase